MGVPAGLVAMVLTLAAITLVYGVVMLTVLHLGTGDVPRGLRGLATRLGRARSRRRRPPPPPTPPILLALELRRLGHALAHLEATQPPGKAARLAALRGAYDATLIDYAHAVGVAADSDHRLLSEGERFALEAELIGSGHDW